MPSNNLLDEMIRTTEPVSTDVAISNTFPRLTKEQVSLSDFIDDLNLLEDSSLLGVSSPDDWNVSNLVRLVDIYNEGGQPNITREPDLGASILQKVTSYIPSINRPSNYAMYNPFNNEIYIPESSTDDKDLDSFRNKDNLLQELTHAISRESKTTKGFIPRQALQILFNAASIPGTLLGKDIQRMSYDYPGTEEHYAHRLLYPLLRSYLNYGGTNLKEELEKGTKEYYKRTDEIGDLYNQKTSPPTKHPYFE